MSLVLACTCGVRKTNLSSTSYEYYHMAMGNISSEEMGGGILLKCRRRHCASRWLKAADTLAHSPIIRDAQAEARNPFPI